MCNHQPIYQQADYGIYLRCIKCYVRSPVRPTLEGARRAWRSAFGEREYGADTNG